jgi:mono/diheme cytochrome c family protein
VVSAVVCQSVCLLVAFSGRAVVADEVKGSGENGRLTADEVKKLKNPVRFSKASLARGRILYIRDCNECHGADGKSQVDVIANATDLTEPKLWKSGTSEGEVFRSIRDGAGDSMPPFSDKIEKSEDMWHLVNYVRSLWPDAVRPKLEETQPN